MSSQTRLTDASAGAQRRTTPNIPTPTPVEEEL